MMALAVWFFMAHRHDTASLVVRKKQERTKSNGRTET